MLGYFIPASVDWSGMFDIGWYTPEHECDYVGQEKRVEQKVDFLDNCKNSDPVTKTETVSGSVSFSYKGFGFSFSVSESITFTVGPCKMKDFYAVVYLRCERNTFLNILPSPNMYVLQWDAYKKTIEARDGTCP